MVRNRSRIDTGELRISCRHCSLSELCLPRALSRQEVDLLDDVVHRHQALERGQRLYETGEPFHSLYVVRSGSLKTAMSTADGAEQIVGFHLPGELVGLDGFSGDHHNCAAEALETTTLCSLPVDSIDDLATQIPSLNHQLRRMMSHELASDQSMLLLLGKSTAEVRLAAFLVSISSRFAARGFSHRRFNLSMSRHDIGNYLGLALETVSRHLARLQHQGIVQVERRAIEILDLARLRARADSVLRERN